MKITRNHLRHFIQEELINLSPRALSEDWAGEGRQIQDEMWYNEQLTELKRLLKINLNADETEQLEELYGKIGLEWGMGYDAEPLTIERIGMEILAAEAAAAKLEKETPVDCDEADWGDPRCPRMPELPQDPPEPEPEGFPPLPEGSKITRRQLRQIINEELSRLNEEATNVRSYLVKRGDTLSGVTQRFSPPEVTIEMNAALNNLSHPYTIVAGKNILLYTTPEYEGEANPPLVDHPSTW